MDIKVLESLGFNKEELFERIVEKAVDELLTSSGFDPETEEETRYQSQFKKEIDARIKAAVDAKIGSIAEEHLLPRVGELIEKADMRKTNEWGEAKSPPMSFKEYIAYRAENYMSEPVNYNGVSKSDLESRGESSYSWRENGPRLTVLMKMYITSTMESAAKTALTDVNKSIAKGIEKAATDAIASVSKKLQISVTAQ